MNKDEIIKALEDARAARLEKLKEYEASYHTAEDGFAILPALPENVQLHREGNTVWFSGHVAGLQEMTRIMQAFSHDDDTMVLGCGNFLFSKPFSEPDDFDGLTVVAMPPRAWEIWGGKMGDIAFGYDGFDELSFNMLGFYEEDFPVDVGVRITSGKELLENKDEE